MRLARIAAGITLLPILAGLLAAAPYRLNRATDSALSLYIDNDVSAAADAEGNLHLVYTDSAAGNRVWQIYYRSLKDGYWSIPASLTTSLSGVADNRSPDPSQVRTNTLPRSARASGNGAV